MGSGDTVVTVFGSSAGSLSQIVVRGLDSQWNPINVTSASGTVAQFTLPGALLSQSGFLEVAPIQDDGTSIPLMVYDPTLPAVGTGANLQGLFIDNDNEGTITPILITLGGANFTNGMTIVLGRGTTPGVALPTTFVDSNALQAQIPVPFAGEADDLFAAVRSAEGTLLSPTVPYPRPTLVHVATSAFPGEPDLTVNTISPGIDPAEAASVTLFGPTETGITSINGNMVETIGLASNHPQQFLTISGANLADGMQVDFSTMKGGQVLHRTAPLTGTHVVASLISSNDLPPISTTSLMRSKVAVPQDIVDTKLKGIQIKSDKAKSNSAVVNADPPTVVPFGGRASFQVYQEPGGEMHIEALSRAPATYQPVTNAVLSIANDAQYRPGFPTIQLERDDKDPLYLARIRGTALTQLPCAAIVNLKLNPPVTCDPTPRPHAQLQATVSGKIVATRDVESMATPLGTDTPIYDSLAHYYGDLYGVPPNYLKSQALQESADYTQNFRYEFTTLNVGCLSGDLGVNTGVCDGNANIPREPWNHYVVAGDRLGTYRAKTLAIADKADAREFQKFLFQNDTETEFDLDVSVKRTVGGVLVLDQFGDAGYPGEDVASEVAAQIQSPDGAILDLKPVHLETVWQRVNAGSNGSKGVDPQVGVCNPGVTVDITTLHLTNKQFAICHNSGQVFLGAPLLPGQQLFVYYWPVQKGVTDFLQQTVVSIPADCDLAAKAPSLDSLQAQLSKKNQLIYTKGEPLAHFLQTNVAHGTAFLTATEADKAVEFTVDQSSKPKQPRDPRYQFMTTQPYASSSYGFFQLTLLPFTAGSSQVQLNKVFNPGYTTTCPIAKDCASTITPLYQLITQPQTNFDLAGSFHVLSLKALKANNQIAPCQPDNCGGGLWQEQWTQVINQFNAKGRGYTYSVIKGLKGIIGLSDIVSKGESVFAPQNPNPQ